MAGEGLVPKVPSSVTVSNGSASINLTGSIDITSASTVQINDVFDAGETSYVVYIDAQRNGDIGNITAQLSVSGSPDTGANYSRQYYGSLGNTQTYARDLAQSTLYFGTSASFGSGNKVYIYQPAIAAETTTTSVGIIGEAGNTPGASASVSSRWQDACSHNKAVAYDGLLIGFSANATGRISIFGFEE